MSLALVVAGLATTVMIAAQGTDPAVSSAWPRPFDPAKPFNMLGVPGVSVEQRKRAEDLLVRSLAEAPRWSDYHKTVAAGWSSIETPRPGGFEHVINPYMLDDEHMLDPRHPESLVYQLKGEERIFVAYMYMAKPAMDLDHPFLVGFAGRLIEWHVHRDVCIILAEGDVVGRVAGFAQEDGTCEMEGATTRTLDPRVLTGEVPEGATTAVPELAMTHVWVAARECGPFSTLAGFAQGDTLTPLEERVDLCRH